MRKNPDLSETGFAITSRSKLYPGRKRKNGIGKHTGSTKSKVLPSYFIFCGF